MAHLTGIGIENFRVFKDYTEFDFAPITILTGANNSGKSSLFKALLLLQDSFTGERLEELDFSKGSHKAGDMSNVLNNKEKPLIFYFPFGFYDIYGLIIGFEFDFKKSEANNQAKKYKSNLNKITIWDKNNSTKKNDFKILLEVSLEKENIFVDLVKWKLVFKDIDNTDKEKRLKDAEKVEMERQKQEILDSKIEEYLRETGKSWPDYKDEEVKEDKKTNLPKLTSNLYSPIKKAREKILKEMYKVGKISHSDYHGEQGEKQNDSSSNDREVNLSKIDKLKTEKIEYQHLFSLNDEDLRKFHQKDYKREGINLKQDYPDYNSYSPLLDVQDNKSLTVYYIADVYATKTLEQKHITILSDLLKFINKDLFSHIKGFTNLLSNLIAVRGTNERIYKDNSALGDILKQLYFQNIRSDSEEIVKFANDWLKKFEIKHFDRIIIENQPDLEINLLYLQAGEDEKVRSFLIDLGFGSQQLLTILLKIVLEGIKDKSPEEMDSHQNMNMYIPKTLLIEEPEANLHPKYQSLLADMLIDAADKFRIQFVIETHSEYLIRKLQYWVAKGTIKPTDVALYYLNDPESENVKNGKAKQVERIEIKKDGSIEENYEKYWSGFFDERERLQREIQEAKELHRIKQEKEILENELLKVDYKCKCLIFTEDSESKRDFSETVFYDICGFSKDETRIIYYEGKDNLYPAIIATEVIKKDKPKISHIIFHRDRDIYEGNEDLVFGKARKKIGELNQKGEIKYFLFLTENYDLESYFLNPNHIIELYPQLSLQEAERLILQATEAKKEEAIRRLSEKFDEIRAIHKGERKTTNPLDIVEEVKKKYNGNVVRYRYGKFVLKALEGLLGEKEMKKRLGGRNIDLTCKTSSVQIPELQEIAKEIWGKS